MYSLFIHFILFNCFYFYFLLFFIDILFLRLSKHLVVNFVVITQPSLFLDYFRAMSHMWPINKIALTENEADIFAHSNPEF